MTETYTINIYKDMNILIVDDDSTTLQLFKLFLKNIFKNIVLAKNAKEALSYFEEENFDLLITDYQMPTINGIELISSIRKTNKNIPIILVTASEEYEVYQQALNLNVTHSLTKPIIQEALHDVLNQTIEPIYFYRATQKIKREELEQLKDQKIYHKKQEKQAFLKEHQAIRNDFYYSYYQQEEDVLWYLDGSYRPYDILSGDTYSIRSLDEKRAFFFIIDAMGKGVSASVTSIIASSYINHLIDTYKQDFNFTNFMQEFNNYITKSLLNEEVLSVLFAELDFFEQTLSVSSYGMPPILMCDKQNNLIKIKTNNLPISVHNSKFNIQCHEVHNIDKMLFYSDGLIESSLENGELYFSHLKEDFKNSNTCSSFLRKLYSKVPNPDDDITLLFFQKRQLKKEKMVSLSCFTNIKEIDIVIANFHTYLIDKGIDHIHTSKLGMIFTEMIMNAYEHGNLQISNEQKKKLLLEGKFENELRQRELSYGKKEMKINYLIYTEGKGKCLKFDIEDEGEGFDTKIFKKLIFDTSSVNGRGFKIAKKMVDAIYYSPKGNHVILHKYIPSHIS